MAQLMHCHSLSLAPVNPDWFYLSGTSSLGSPRQTAIKRMLDVVVVVAKLHFSSGKIQSMGCNVALFA